jgi:hypothetical protein
MRPSYTIHIVNSSDAEVSDAHVFRNDFESVGGVVVPGGNSWDSFIRARILRRVIVRWRTLDGIPHREEVKVPEDLPRRFRGTLRFEIQQDGHVEVRVESASRQVV